MMSKSTFGVWTELRLMSKRGDGERGSEDVSPVKEPTRADEHNADTDSLLQRLLEAFD